LVVSSVRLLRVVFGFLTSALRMACCCISSLSVRPSVRPSVPCVLHVRCGAAAMRGLMVVACGDRVFDGWLVDWRASGQRGEVDERLVVVIVAAAIYRAPCSWTRKAGWQWPTRQGDRDSNPSEAIRDSSQSTRRTLHIAVLTIARTHLRHGWGHKIICPKPKLDLAISCWCVHNKPHLLLSVRERHDVRVPHPLCHQAEAKSS